MKSFFKKIQYNSPVVLTFALVSFCVLGLGQLTRGWTDQMLFCVYRSSLLDPLTYVRLFGHVLGHANLAHLTGNMMLFLLLGPILEEKYGSRAMLQMFAVVALVTGVVNMVFFPGVALMGASGIVFMMIVLASMTSVGRGQIPLTLIVVAILYLGQEVYDGIFTVDNISHLSHIVGGVCGCAFGFTRK
jgi:rhomboid protease GluP